MFDLLRVRIIIVAALLIIGLALAMFLYNKPHAELQNKTADFSLTATDLFADFDRDEAAANAKYLDKIIQISGIIDEKIPSADGGMTLLIKDAEKMFGVNCAFLPEASAELEQLQTGTQVSLKGICTGMLLDVNLSRCVLVN